MPTKAIEFLSGPPPKSVKGLYALFGGDSYLIREALDRIVAIAGHENPEDVSITRFAGDSARLADVFDEVRTLPLLGDRRVIVVDPADPLVSAHRKEFETFAEHPPTAATLVLVFKLWNSATKLAKIVEKTALAVECKQPKPDELPNWLARRAKERDNVTLTPRAASLLVELVGDEVGLLVSELDKLVTYIGTRKRIDPEDVSLVVDAGRVETIWKALDAALGGQTAPALDYLDRLLTDGEAPMRLFAGIASSVRKLHHAGVLRMRGRDMGAACQEAGIPPFFAEKTGKQLQLIGRGGVDRIPRLLLQTDLDLKGGSDLSDRAILERLLIRLGRP